MDQGDRVRVVGLPEICGQITENNDSKFIGQVGTIKDMEYMGENIPIYHVKLDSEQLPYWWPETSLVVHIDEEDLPLHLTEDV